MTVVSAIGIGCSTNSGLPDLVTFPITVRWGRGIIVNEF